jgi:hypothetical protein
MPTASVREPKRNVREPLRSVNVREPLRAANVRDSLQHNVRDSLKRNVRDSLKHNVRDSLKHNVRDIQCNLRDVKAVTSGFAEPEADKVISGKLIA